MKRQVSNLVGLSTILAGGPMRAAYTDTGNANHLFGDVYQGDPQGPYGDAYDDDEYGDVETAGLDTYNTLIGDPDDEEIGALKLRIPKLSKGAKIAGLGAGGLLTAGAIYKILHKRKQRRAALRKTQAANAAENTIANQIVARRMMGKIPRTAAMPFYSITGATLNQYPLAPTEVFPADTLKFNMDNQSTQTPFEVEIINATFAGVTWTATAPGVVANRFYTCVVLTVGISVLTANPGTIFNVAGTFPTINGTLTVAANPWSFTIRKGYYAKLMIFPWILVTNKPLLALGLYNNATPIVVTVTGLPSNASVSLVVPGSQHAWTIAMRNRLV